MIDEGKIASVVIFGIAIPTVFAACGFYDLSIATALTVIAITVVDYIKYN